MGELGVLRPPLLTIGRGWAVYVGPVEPGRLHRHQAAQLAWSSEGTLRLEGAWGVLDAPGHFLTAGVVHRLVASQPVRMVFLDPSMPGPTPLSCQAVVAASLTALQADLLEHELDRWLQGQGMSNKESSSGGATRDARWVTVLDWMEHVLDRPVHVEDAAEVVGLSSSRFMHWFAEAAGLPFRAYVRWLRLQRAVRTLADGCTLTEAAYMAGFADSAHLTRTFVATFGVRPAPLRAARIVCVDQTTPPLTPFGLALIDIN